MTYWKDMQHVSFSNATGNEENSPLMKFPVESPSNIDINNNNKWFISCCNQRLY